MAHLREHRDANGKLTSFYIRVYRGRDAAGKQLKPFSTVFNVPPSWSESTARKKAEAAAAVFEAKCLEGQVVDSRQTFEQYADYVLMLKEAEKRIKHSTLVRYRELVKRINNEIGYIKLRDLTAKHLNTLYMNLAKEKAGSPTATAKQRYYDVISNKKLGAKAAPEIVSAVNDGKKIGQDLLAAVAGIARSTAGQIANGQSVRREKAEAVSRVLGYSASELFTIADNINALSPKTILEHHRLISSVLAVAVKEGVLSENVASRAAPPQVDAPEVNYLQPEVVKEVIEAIQTADIWWKTIALLLIYTGARRGEILGLRECDIDFTRKQVHIFGNLQYTPDRGIYWETPKTKKSKRFVSVPDDVLAVVKEYLAFKEEYQITSSPEWEAYGLLFINPFGYPYNPDSSTDWFANLAKKHNLPHLNPQAFRHSMASVLIFNKADIVSVAHRLGHSSPTTTEKIYAHLIDEAEDRNLEIVSSVYK